MNDLISRRAAIEAVSRGCQEFRGIFAECEKNLNELPLAQPIGKWIEDGYSHDKAVCDQCGEPCATYINGTPRDRFCKWCGAKMEG